MKKYYKTLKYKKYNDRHSRKLFKRKLEYKTWKRIKLRREQGLPEEKLKRMHEGFDDVNIPNQYSFLRNPNDVILKIKEIKENLELKKKTFINLKEVEEIDNGAITVLLSLMTDFKVKRVGFNGNFPKNNDAKKLLLSSGFFEHLFGKVDRELLFDENSKYAYGQENQIITKPGKKVIGKLASHICESVSHTLECDSIATKGLYRTLIELMHNTNNHANDDEKGKELWWLTVHHDKIKKKVFFVFLDFGVGIFNSLKNKPRTSALYGAYNKLKERVLYGTEEKILKLILEGELKKTATDESYRGKGLPGIYEVCKRKQIYNLHIITNRVYADVSKENYQLLSNEFSGTFVYWEMSNGSEEI